MSDPSRLVNQTLNQNLNQTNVGQAADDGVSNNAGDDGQVQGMQGPISHEHEPARTAPAETVQYVEVAEHEISPEVAEYVEKVEKENLQLEKQVVHQGQPVVEPINSLNEPQIVLPMTQSGVSVSMKMKVMYSARWLAEWCMRIMKKFHGRVFYASEEQK